ncbi:MAG: isoprenylcysteine carboxylmethyltransferase family protein [Acidobacteriota bacterium]|nr:isoprenylcysteine carboxylmethyltransferase family protein [Acidobacteriota bacterium]
MKASAVEFRLRLLTHALVYTLGFWAPWTVPLHWESGIGTRQLVAAWLMHTLHLGFENASIAVTSTALLCALLAACLRTWGTAYLGADVMSAGAMHGDAVVADGPYRYVRNPLYLGTLLHTFALAMIMPPTGAIFAIVAIGIIQLRLIGGEEAFLTGKLGQRYRAYQAAVPRLLPSIVPRVAASGRKPAWGKAILAESYMWGVVVTYVAVGWLYNSWLLGRGVLISLGVSLVLRGLLPRSAAASTPGSSTPAE